MDKLAYKYREYRTGSELEQSPTNTAAQSILDQAKAAARSAGIMAPQTPSVFGELGAMPEKAAEENATNLRTLSAGQGPLRDAPQNAPQMRQSTPEEKAKARAAPTAQEAYDPSQASFAEQSAMSGYAQAVQGLAGTYAGAADFYGTLDNIAGIVSRKAGMGKPELFEQLKASSEYWAEHYQGKVPLDDYMTRVVGGVLGSGPALVEFSLGPAWAALKGYAQDENLGDALYSAARRVAAGAVFKSAHTLDAAGRVAAGTAYMTGENAAEQFGQTGTVDPGQLGEAAGVGLGMMLSGGLAPGNKAGMRQRQEARSWVETSKQGDELFKAFDAKTIDQQTKDLALDFYAADPRALNDTTVTVVDKVNLIRKGVDDWILRGQGIDPATQDAGKQYKITGKTSTKRVGPEDYRTAIELYQGHDAQTLAEEWFHRQYDRLSPKELAAVTDTYSYYRGTLPADAQPMSEGEFYAKSATSKLFSEHAGQAWAPDKPAWYDALKNTRKKFLGLLDTIRGIPGAELDETGAKAVKQWDVRKSFEVRKVEDIIYDPTPQEPMSRKYAADKGVNILRINSNDDLTRVVELIAQDSIDSGAYEQQTRGRVSWDQTREEAGIPLAGAAASEGQKPALRADQMLFRKQGDILNASQSAAARQIHRELMAQMFDLVEQAKRTGSDTDMDVAARAVDAFAKIDASLMGYRAEQARGLQAWSMPVGDVRTQVPVGAFAQLAAKHGGEKNAHAILDTLHDMMKLDADGKLDLTQVSSFLNRVEKASTFDMILEARYIAMLMNPATHIKNTLGNTIALGMQVPERFLAGAIGKTRGAWNDQAHLDRVEIGESAAMLYGAVNGLSAGAKAFLTAVKTGESADPLGKIEVHRRAITAENMGVDPESHWGKFIDFTAERLRTGNMMLGAEDDFFKAIGYSMELNARAHRAATREGLRGQDFADRVQELTTNPPWDLQMKAMDFAHYSTFTNQLGEGMTKIQSALGSDATVTLKNGKTLEVPTGKLFRIAVPFLRTPTNIVRYGIERSPFAVFMPSVMQGLATGGAERDLAIARITMGSTIGAMVAMAAANGLITGGGPSDPKELENLRATGWQEYSFGGVNNWTSYKSFEPYSMIIGAAADIALFDTYLEENEKNTAITMVAGAMSEAILSKTYLQGTKDMIDVLFNPQRYGDTALEKFAASWVPSPVKAIRRDVDPMTREVWGVTDALKNSLPWMSKDLYPKRNRYGEPVTMGDVWLSNLLDPMRKSEIKNESNSPTFELDKTIQENHIAIPRTAKMFHQDGVSVQLTPEEFDDYQRLPAELGLVEALQRMIATPAFQGASGGPDGLKAHMIQEVFGDFRDRAKYELEKASRGVPGGLAERLELERLDRQMKQEAMQ